jgi:transcriptional regulator with XRE-family HTH domain
MKDPSMSQGQLAQAIGLDSGRKGISRWENGDNLPSALSFLALLVALGIHLTEPPPDPPRAVNSELRELRLVIEGLNGKKGEP